MCWVPFGPSISALPLSLYDFLVATVRCPPYIERFTSYPFERQLFVRAFNSVHGVQFICFISVDTIIKILFYSPVNTAPTFLEKLTLSLFSLFASASLFLHILSKHFYPLFWRLSIFFSKDNPEKTSAVIRGDYYLTGVCRYRIYFFLAR